MTTNFDTIYPWAGMQAVTVDGQSMIYVPKFYYKIGTAPTGSQQAGNKCKWISDRKLNGYVVHPAFMKDGVEKAGFYVGAYECCADPTNGNKAGSLIGKSPLVNIDFPTMVARCAARNTGTGEQAGWHLWNIYELAAIQTLALIELGTPDVQTKIAAGNVNSSAAVATGSTAAKYRGISELWGNVWHMVDGLKGNGTTIQMLDREGKNTYINTGVVANTGSGYTKEMFTNAGTGFDFNDVYVPSTVDATATNGTYGDYYWAATSNFVCYHGGGWGNGAMSGLFTLHLGDVSGYYDTGVGGRLAKYVD